MFGKRYKAVFLRMENNKPIKIGEKSFENTDKTVNFKNKTIPILLNIAYYDGKTAICFYEWLEEKGKVKQLSFQELLLNINTDELDSLIDKNIVVGFLGKINKAFDKMEISGTALKYLVVLGFGALLGYVVGANL